MSVGSWQVTVDPSKREILLFGASGRFRPEIFSGGMVPDVFHAFRALEAPVNANYILRRWTVGVPMKFRNWTENGKERRFLRLSGENGEEFVLDFRQDRIPQELLYDLREIFKSAGSPAEGETDEGHDDQVQAHAGVAGDPRQGQHPRHRHAAHGKGRWAERPRQVGG